MQVFTIPLLNVPQRFTVELSGVSYILICKWNGEMPAWVLDIFDEVTQAPIIIDLPLVAGQNLLEQYGHLGIPGSLIVYTDGDQYASPTLENIGQEANLYYVADA